MRSIYERVRLQKLRELVRFFGFRRKVKIKIEWKLAWLTISDWLSCIRLALATALDLVYLLTKMLDIVLLHNILKFFFIFSFFSPRRLVKNLLLHTLKSVSSSTTWSCLLTSFNMFMLSENGVSWLFMFRKWHISENRLKQTKSGDGYLRKGLDRAKKEPSIFLKF